MPIITKDIPIERSHGDSVSLTYTGTVEVPDITSMTYSDGELIGNIFIDRIVSVTNFSDAPVTAPNGLTYAQGKWDVQQQGGMDIDPPIQGGQELIGDEECLIHVVGYIVPHGMFETEEVTNNGDILTHLGVPVVNTPTY